MVLTMTRLHYDIPEDVHRQAKTAAARMGITLREFLIRSLQTAAAAVDVDSETEGQ